MASVKQAFSGALSQGVVVCLLALFIAIALAAMVAGGNDETDWIGMTVKPLEAGTAAAQGIPSDVGGVVVEEAAGIAGRAGIREGDVVLAINGYRVEDMVDFSHISGETNLSKGVQVDVVRRGSRMPIFVFPSAAATQPPAQTAQPGIPAPPTVVDRQWLGIEAEPFAAGEGRELGIPAGIQGVLIDAVAPGSRAEQSGLAANDLIVAVNGQKINTRTDLWGALAGLKGTDRLEFGIFRNGQLTTAALPTASGALAGGLARPGWGCWGWNAAGTALYSAPATGFAGRMGGQGLGPGGTLVCPSCGTQVVHQRGVPCYTVACPSCGTTMVRAQ